MLFPPLPMMCECSVCATSIFRVTRDDVYTHQPYLLLTYNHCGDRTCRCFTSLRMWNSLPRGLRTLGIS